MSPHNSRRRRRVNWHVPQELEDLPRWIDWRYQKKLGKVRKRPRLSLADPDFPKAFKDVKTPPDDEGGLGICFTGGIRNAEGAQLLAFDLDACRDPESGVLAGWVEHMRAMLPPTYWEITPSGAGLRAFVWVRNLPDAVRIMHPAKIDESVVALPEGTAKKAEIQVFGMGVANFVAVTGRILPGAEIDIATTDDIEALLDAYNGHGVPVDASAMPTGNGAAPGADELLGKLEGLPEGEALLAGDFEELGLPSASEAWFRLVTRALGASNGHGEVVAEALLMTEVWGKGLIDSAEPDRYASEDWVRGDVIRIAAKLAETGPAPAHEVFGPFDPSSFEVPARATTGSLLRPAGEKKKGLLTHVSEYGDELGEDFFVIYNVLPAMGLVQFFGKPGCGKTPFVMSAALHVAAGRETWFGYDIDKPGTVVYMAGEGVRAVHRRFKADATKLGIDLNAVPLFITERPGQLTQRADVKIWAAEIQEALAGKPCAMIVVDTQAQNFGPGDENSTEHMNAFVQNLTTLAKALDTCIVLVHHTGHQNTDRARGSTVLHGALDACFEIYRGDGDGARVTATSTKSKDWGSPEPLVGMLDVVELGKDRKDRPITSVRLNTTAIDAAEVFAPDVNLEDDDDLIAVLEAVQKTEGKKTNLNLLQLDVVGMGRTKFREKMRLAKSSGLIETVRESPRARTSYVLTPDGLMLLWER